MLLNKGQCIHAIQTIARVLGDLNERVVYVGGAVVGLYIDDPAAPMVRPTKDVDIVVEVASASELEKLRQELAGRGIHFTPEVNVLCRFKYQNILIDVMATKNVDWAPANPWFKAGYELAHVINLEDIAIRIMPLAHFLAAKFAALKDRGQDPRTSSDFEDIVYILDNRKTLVNDILKSDDDVKAFLRAELSPILDDDLLQEAVRAHLEPETQMERYKRLLQKIKEILQSFS